MGTSTLIRSSKSGFVPSSISSGMEASLSLMYPPSSLEEALSSFSSPDRSSLADQAALTKVLSCLGSGQFLLKWSSPPQLKQPLFVFCLSFGSFGLLDHCCFGLSPWQAAGWYFLSWILAFSQGFVGLSKPLLFCLLSLFLYSSLLSGYFSVFFVSSSPFL